MGTERDKYRPEGEKAPEQKRKDESPGEGGSQRPPHENRPIEKGPGQGQGQKRPGVNSPEMDEEGVE